MKYVKFFGTDFLEVGLWFYDAYIRDNEKFKFWTEQHDEERCCIRRNQFGRSKENINVLFPVFVTIRSEREPDVIKYCYCNVGYYKKIIEGEL